MAIGGSARRGAVRSVYVASLVLVCGAAGSVGCATSEARLHRIGHRIADDLDAFADHIRTRLGPEDARAARPVVTPPQVGARRVGGEREYVVRRGDTLTGIASRHGVGVDALIGANRIAAPDALEVGQRLVVPGAGAVAAPASRRTARTATLATPATAPSAGTDIARPDCAISEVDRDLRDARFEEVLAGATRARAGLRPAATGTAASECRAKLEVLSGTAEVALGRSDAARASFQRALDANPQLELDGDSVSPKVMRAFRDARHERVRAAQPSRSEVSFTQTAGPR